MTTWFSILPQPLNSAKIVHVWYRAWEALDISIPVVHILADSITHVSDLAFSFINGRHILGCQD